MTALQAVPGTNQAPKSRRLFHETVGLGQHGVNIMQTDITMMDAEAEFIITDIHELDDSRF